MKLTNGVGFDLPTESMWEVAVRGGTTTSWVFGNSDSVAANYCWLANASGNVRQAVGQKLPTPLGLYDTLGNVWKLCRDACASVGYSGSGTALSASNGMVPNATGTYRVRRGGRSGDPYSMGRSSTRYCASTTHTNAGNLGFRLSLIVK